MIPRPTCSPWKWPDAVAKAHAGPSKTDGVTGRHGVPSDAGAASSGSGPAGPTAGAAGAPSGTGRAAPSPAAATGRSAARTASSTATNARACRSTHGRRQPRHRRRHHLFRSIRRRRRPPGGPVSCRSPPRRALPRSKPSLPPLLSVSWVSSLGSSHQARTRMRASISFFPARVPSARMVRIDATANAPERLYSL